MQHLTHSIIVACPPEFAFDFVADLRNEGSWWEQLDSVKKISDGPIGAGTQFEQVTNVGFIKIYSKVEVTGYDRPQIFDFENESSQLEYKFTYNVAPHDDGCIMNMTADFKAYGVLKWVLPLANKIIERQLHNNFDNLKRVLEERSPKVQA